MNTNKTKKNTKSRTYAFLLKNVMKNNFNYGFAQEDLWNYCKNKPIKKCNIDDVKHWIYSPCWSHKCILTNTIKSSHKQNYKKPIDCFYSIFQVINQPKRFPDDIMRIKKSNTSYPLIVIEDEYDKNGCILDGNHRFAKLILDGVKEISFHYITLKELENLKIKM